MPGPVQQRFTSWHVFQSVWWTLLVGAALSLGGFHLFQFNLWLVMVLALLGLHLVTGLGGMISLGHGALMGLGAYAAATLALHGQASVVACAAAALTVGALSGAALALVAGRLSGHLLALATFALAAAWPQWLKSPGVSAFTGGSQGLVWPAIDSSAWEARLYTMGLLALLAGAFAALRWAHTRHWGLALRAQGDQPDAAAELGIAPRPLKVIAFALSGAFTSVAGALGAAWVGFVSPDAYSAWLSITLLVGLAIAGVGNARGLWWGAAFVQFVPNWAAEWSQAMPWAVQGLCLLVVAYLGVWVSKGGMRRWLTNSNRSPDAEV